MAILTGTNGHDNSDLGGADLFGTDQSDFIYGYDGDDYINGRRGADSIFGGRGHNTIFGGEGDDYVHTEGLTGRYDGGNGVDTIDLSALGQRAYVSLAQGLGNFGAMNLTSATAFVMANFENVSTGAGDDVILGSAAANRISPGAGADRVWAGGGADLVYGGQGDDVIRGEAGADELHGNEGQDTLRGGAGDDVLLGGTGNDLLDGGAGFDAASYATHNAAVNVDMLAGTAWSRVGTVNETDTLVDIERVLGSAFGDQVVAGATTTVDGAAGDDWVWSGSGANRLVGGAGVDSLSYGYSTSGVRVSLATGAVSGGFAQGDSITGFERLYGSTHADALTGDARDNQLYGNWGDDTLQGGGGRDLLVGGAGADVLQGGSGADTFQFAAGDSPVSGPDRILDFQRGLDRIDLAGVDANQHASGWQDFSKVTTYAAPGSHPGFTAGTVNVRHVHGDTLVEINTSDNTTNGHDAPEMLIRLDGIHALTSADFLF